MNEEELKKVRDFLVDNFFRNPHFVLYDNIASDEVKDIDLVDLVASLYDMLHLSVTGEHYDYMWHWCNKVGGWCDDLALAKLLEIDTKEDILRCRHCKYASIHCTQYDTDVDALDGCSNGERDD